MVVFSRSPHPLLSLAGTAKEEICMRRSRRCDIGALHEYRGQLGTARQTMSWQRCTHILNVQLWRLTSPLQANKAGTHFSEDQILKWFVQMTLALSHVHSMKVTYQPYHRTAELQFSASVLRYSTETSRHRIYSSHARVRLCLLAT